LRRASKLATAVSHVQDVVRFGGFRLNIGSRELTDAAGKAVPLTTGEFDLLGAFIANPNRVLSRDDLMNRIHGRDAGPFDRAIDVQIGRFGADEVIGPARAGQIGARCRLHSPHESKRLAA
jgi:two-component system OmpR family response regulator